MTINFSSAGTFLHLNAISTVPDRYYPFKVQTSNEQNLQDIPFYTLLIFFSAVTFNFSSAGTINFSSTGTFLHLIGIRTVPDTCYPFKVQTSNEQNLQDIPHIPYSFLVLLGPLVLVLLGPLILVPLGPLILVPLGPSILVLLGPFCT